MKMSKEKYNALGSRPTKAEWLLQDPDIQARLKEVFADLDNLYASIEEHTQYRCTMIDFPSITPDGYYIEASTVATPLPPKEMPEDERDSVVAEHHRTTEYMIFAFNLEELKDPSFKLRPIDLAGATCSVYRGGGIDIELASREPKPEMIINIDDTDYEHERRNVAYSDWAKRHRIHLPQNNNDHITYMGEYAERFREVRIRSGVEL